MPYADNQGIHIYYETAGAGPSLVLQHWSLNTLECWYDHSYVPALQNDYRVILLDARGHGGSDKPHDPAAYTLERRASDIVAVLDDLGIDRAHYLGYSMGAWIGFGVAAYAPQRVQSMILGGGHPYGQTMDVLRQYVRHGLEHGYEAYIELWESNSATFTPAQKQRIAAFDFEALWAIASDRPSLDHVLPAMTMPCLLFAGEDDPIFPHVQRCARELPNAQFVALPGCDHGTAIERRDDVLPHVTRFLAGVNSQVRKLRQE